MTVRLVSQRMAGRQAVAIHSARARPGAGTLDPGGCRCAGRDWPQGSVSRVDPGGKAARLLFGLTSRGFPPFWCPVPFLQSASFILSPLLTMPLRLPEIVEEIYASGRSWQGRVGFLPRFHCRSNLSFVDLIFLKPLSPPLGFTAVKYLLSSVIFVLFIRFLQTPLRSVSVSLVACPELGSHCRCSRAGSHLV